MKPLIIGLLSGSFVTFLFSKFYWEWKAMATKKRTFKQFEKKINEEIKQGLKLEKDIQSITHKFLAEKEEKQRIAEECEAFRQEATTNINDLMDQIAKVESSYQGLRDQHGALMIERDQLETELGQLQDQSESASHLLIHEQKLRFEADKKLNHIIQTLLPNLTFLRNSMDFLNSSSRLTPLLEKLKEISNGDCSEAIQLRETHGEWFECQAPRSSMSRMRIYFRKCQTSHNQFQVLITEKTQKTQTRDYAWLNEHISEQMSSRSY